MTITKEAILAALSKVQEPELHKDLVTLNMIRELEIKDNVVSFTVMLTTPACPLRGQIEKEARQAVMSVEGVKSVSINGNTTASPDRTRGAEAFPKTRPGSCRYPRMKVCTAGLSLRLGRPPVRRMFGGHQSRDPICDH